MLDFVDFYTNFQYTTAVSVYFSKSTSELKSIP